MISSSYRFSANDGSLEAVSAPARSTLNVKRDVTRIASGVNTMSLVRVARL